jgi:hypothetical protein
VTEAPERTAVYRICGEEDVLIYIGMTNGVPFRWNGHQAVQPWWSEVRSMTFEWYDYRSEAADAEKAAILAEQPKYNVTYLKPGHGRRGRGRKEPTPVGWESAPFEPQADDDALLSVEDVAKMVRMQPSTAKAALRRTGGPQGFTLGSQHLFRKGEIRRWIAAVEASQRRTAPRPVEKPPEMPRPKPRRLSAVPAVAQDDDALFDRGAVS